LVGWSFYHRVKEDNREAGKGARGQKAKHVNETGCASIWAAGGFD
jgi:hypothetical protein